MPPVVIAAVISAGATVIGIGANIYTQKKQAKKMEDSMRRMEEQQDAANKALSTQESEFYGGGGGASVREDTKVMLKTSKAPRNVVFGRDRVSGPMMPFFSYTQDGILYHRFAVILAGHECDAIETVYLQDEPLTIDSAGWVVGPAKFTDNGRSLFFIEKKLGDQAQTASQYLIDAAAAAGTPDAWDATRKATGVCYVMVHMEANYDALREIGLPNVSAIVRGVKAYDPRTNTTAWTRNPALLARWFLVDSIYSPLTSNDDINQAELIASANVCDEPVAFSASITAQRYACDGALSSTANPLENLNKIMAAMDGDAVWVSGKWQLIAGYYKAPTLAIDESHVAGGQISISPYTPTSQIINAISGQFKGPDTKYQAAGYPAIAPLTYLNEDGGEVYERKDDFDLVNDATRCQMIAWQRLSRSRQQLAIALMCNLKAYNSSPLQSVALSLSEFGYRNKVFQVRKRSFNGFSVEYFLQETGPAVWNWNYALANQIVEIRNINVPVNLAVASLKNVVVQSGITGLIIDADGTVRSRIVVTWDPVASYFVKNGGQIEWQYRKSDISTGITPWINIVKTSGNATTAYISPVEDGVAYDLRGRAVSQLGRRGDVTYVSRHVVIGKTEPPPAVLSLQADGSILSWPPVNILDLAGYTLRFNYGSNAAWGTATPINTGVITQSPFDWTLRPAGAVTVLIKAVDTTGNESLQATPLFTNLGDRYIANVVEEFVYNPAFLGTVTGGVRDSGTLLGNSSQAFYPAGNQPMYPSGSEPFYAAQLYDTLVYETEVILISSALAGSLLTLLLTYEGTGLQVEYRTSRPDPMFGGDELDPFWLPESDPMFGTEADWQPWPGQITAQLDIYQFRITISSGPVRPTITVMKVIVDALDIEETIDNLPLAIGGTALPYTKPFTVIKSIQATLQSGLSGAVNIVTNKTNPITPVATAVNSSLVAVAGASGDFTLKGY